ncbi:MAG: hypothetical protein ACLFP4_11460 [Spirochaetales bacterium]
MNGLLYNIFLFLHFVGLAALIGGLLCQFSEPSRMVTPLIIIGASVQLITGVVLLLITIQDANHLKATIKIVLTAIILGLALLRRNKVFAPPFYLSALGLALVNVALGVFW